MAGRHVAASLASVRLTLRDLGHGGALDLVASRCGFTTTLIEKEHRSKKSPALGRAETQLNRFSLTACSLGGVTRRIAAVASATGGAFVQSFPLLCLDRSQRFSPRLRTIFRYAAGITAGVGGESSPTVWLNCSTFGAITRQHLHAMLAWERCAACRHGNDAAACRDRGDEAGFRDHPPRHANQARRSRDQSTGVARPILVSMMIMAQPVPASCRLP